MVAEIQSQPHATALDYNQCPSQNQRKTISGGVSNHQLHPIGSLLGVEQSHDLLLTLFRTRTNKNAR